VQPGLAHQRQQTHRLEGHRLAAGIGPGDHQGIRLRVELDVDRHHRMLVQQRVPGLVQADDTARMSRSVNLPGFFLKLVQHRRNAA
jgi:hypothetical protein